MTAQHVFLKVYQCARCGEDHTGSNVVEFRPFNRPIQAGDWVGKYWGMCPTLNEPILMDREPTEEEKKANET